MARSRAVVVAILAAVLAGSSAVGWWLGAQRRTVDARNSAVVVEVVDGDTVIVRTDDGATDTVRLLGVDTPETRHPERGVECFGPEAADYTRQRLLGEHVELEDDVEHRDRYGRRLAYLSVNGERFNDELLRSGYARLLVIEPNREHAHELLRAEFDAKGAERGLWGACE